MSSDLRNAIRLLREETVDLRSYLQDGQADMSTLHERYGKVALTLFAEPLSSADQFKANALVAEMQADMSEIFEDLHDFFGFVLTSLQLIEATIPEETA